MLLPSFHHPKSSQDRRLGVAGAAVARAGAAGRAGGASSPKFGGFLGVSKILNMDVYMVDLMSKDGGDFAFFFQQK